MPDADSLADLLYQVQRAYEEGLCQDVGLGDLVDVLAAAAREHIAAEIENIPRRPWDMNDADSAEARSARAYGSGLADAARIARGGTP